MRLTPTTTTAVQSKVRDLGQRPKPEQAGTRTKKLRREGGAFNLSQQQREECQTVMAIIRQIEEMEYKEQAAKGGALSSGLEGRVEHGSGKVGEKRRFRDACDTGWGEAAEEGPRSEGGGAGGEKLKDKEAERDKTGASNAADQASASTTAKKAGASNAANPASLSTTAKETKTRPKTSTKGFKARGRRRPRRRESVLCPREPTQQERRSVGREREWAGRGQEEAL
jgi:hypothetical protein